MKNKEQLKGIREWKNKMNFHITEIHYSADPDKDPKTRTGEKWLISAKNGITPEGWQREYEIDWTIGTGDRIFSEFSSEKHLRKLTPISDFAFLRGWDFGFHYPVMLIAQFDEKERLCILAEFVRENILFDDFLRSAISFCENHFGKAAFYYDFCDPAGAQKNHRSRLTDIEVMARSGIIARYKRSEEPQRTRLLHLLLQENDNAPKMILNSDFCPLLSGGFHGGLVYDPGKPEHAKEIHPYIDLFDALGYLVIGIVDPVSGDPLFPYRKERPEETEARILSEVENEIVSGKINDGESFTGSY